LLLAFRETAAMGVLLGAHLGIVMGLFISLPYGKFAHAIYRFAALIRNAVEERTMPQLGAE
jgi:citrate/tricarballylate utilization protein